MLHTCATMYWLLPSRPYLFGWFWASSSISDELSLVWHSLCTFFTWLAYALDHMNYSQVLGIPLNCCFHCHVMTTGISTQTRGVHQTFYMFWCSIKDLLFFDVYELSMTVREQATVLSKSSLISNKLLAGLTIVRPFLFYYRTVVAFLRVFLYVNTVNI